MGALLWLGARGRCPSCGTGHLFSGLLGIAESCDNCGQSFVGADVGDGPVVPATFLLGILTLAFAGLLELWVAPPLWVHGVVWAPFVVLGTIGLVRLLKGALVALQFKFRDLDKPEKLGGI